MTQQKPLHFDSEEAFWFCQINTIRPALGFVRQGMPCLYYAQPSVFANAICGQCRKPTQSYHPSRSTNSAFYVTPSSLGLCPSSFFGRSQARSICASVLTGSKKRRTSLTQKTPKPQPPEKWNTENPRFHVQPSQNHWVEGDKRAIIFAFLMGSHNATYS